MLLSWSRKPSREELCWPFHDHGVIKTTLGVETTLSRCRNYPLSKGTEMTPIGVRKRSKLLFWIYSVGQFQLQFIWHELHVYEITLVVICEMYNFIICEIYDLIFIYMKIHIWNYQNSHIWNGFHIWNFFFHMWIV
jgi:hypothetical protein